ncbi:putative RNA polymerase II subunit B1 CTD phosphatase Rpap2 isoform X1 [Hylaeus volcanicus]|uniref:putative RNA polymerase II subunit B1 CTD phosphatase Rpap2 isoform X1 n=3 Tax=Hylaeus volcanicus TaxID=313075 RepID=UPI0023B8762D|nr:putative RNA polymerase II subunit B1 CTD phosphatase Rpap2 isoform X1 [Hylaeus volcanicus]
MATSTLKQEALERKKVKKKMSKVQMQLAIIKKKQCDGKALIIVEQLLEPDIHPEWLLYNLRYINKSHMEDVIEERSIIKLCGYVLCPNALTSVVNQKYRISTKENKVYDVTRRKNFCSSQCYGASNYLLEQMLTSPLWLRDKEEIPEFKLLPDELIKSVPGDEIHVWDVNITLNSNSNEKAEELNEICKDLKEEPLDKFYTYDDCHMVKSSQTINETKEINVNIETAKVTEKLSSSSFDKDPEYMKSESINLQDTAINSKQYVNDDTNKEIGTSENVILLDHLVPSDVTVLNNDTISLNEDRDLNKINNEEQSKLSKVLQTKCNTTVFKQNTNIDSSHLIADIKMNKYKKDKQKHRVKVKQSCEFYNLAMHIECNLKEWITEDTLCLLSGEEGIKQQLIDNVIQHDRYLHLCKKLNKLQLDDEKDDRVDLTKSTLKPLPHLSALQEEGKKIELKVRAFYKGDMVIETPKKATEDTEQNDEFVPVVPLTDGHAPKALRRRIFLDKLHRILPDLIRALTGSGLSQHTYSNALIKALVNTFSLSATNIIFKTAEWTLVGLVIIKMLGMIDPQLKVLLSGRQASMYISMILMSYKLDSNYLDRIVAELTSNTKVVDTDDTNNF